MCCYCELVNYIKESQINPAEWVLAIFTVVLAYAAVKQLRDIQDFIKSNKVFNQVQLAEDSIVKQIEFHYKILEGIETEGAKRHAAFRIIYNNLMGTYKSDLATYANPKERIGATFKKLDLEYGYLLRHYYRNLYRIFKEIDETTIDGFDKNHYAKLVRAQLSEYEILLLFYNCIWVGDEDKFVKLVENYELLEGIDYKSLLEPDHYKLYSEKAFGVDFI